MSASIIDVDTLKDRVMGNVGKCCFICFCFFSEIGGQLKMRRSMCWRAEDKEAQTRYLYTTECPWNRESYGIFG